MHIFTYNNVFFEYGSRNKITFVEEGNIGPGADKSKRVPWMKRMSNEELNKFTSLSYIDNEGWLNNKPNSFKSDN